MHGGRSTRPQSDRDVVEVTTLNPPGLLARMTTIAKWGAWGFTPEEALRHQAEVDRIVAELANDHHWRMTAQRDEMERPPRVVAYMEQAYAELHDREWRENLHSYLDDIARERKAT